MRITRLHLQNFLSYRDATLELGDLTALVGTNASGKSNAVSALRLLGDIPQYGLQAALGRRGGFDNLRHRGDRGQVDPTIEVEFKTDLESGISRYELQLASLPGGGYRVQAEKGDAPLGTNAVSFFRGVTTLTVKGLLDDGGSSPRALWPVPESQSALPVVSSVWGLPVWTVLSSLRFVDIEPARVRELQDETPADHFEPDGSNVAICFERLGDSARSEVVDQLSSLVPAVVHVEPRHLDDKVTLRFHLKLEGKVQELSARQMSDGTLRILGILVALAHPPRPSLVVIEEPETAIHLGALRSLVEILSAYRHDFPILITTHSADILDSMSLEDLRVVWWEKGASHISSVAGHTRELVEKGLSTPGELLRSDALDHAVA